MSFEDELYKSLLEESRLHREKVSTIWLQKFSILGAIIAFAATRTEAVHANAQLISAAILSLPLIAVLLDFKLGEFGMHAKIIDNFIIRHFPEPRVLGEWERTKWGISERSDSDHWLVALRSVMTVAVTILPTCLIAVLADLAAKHVGMEAIWQPRVDQIIRWFCGSYLLLGIVSLPAVVLRSPMAKKKSRAARV